MDARYKKDHPCPWGCPGRRRPDSVSEKISQNTTGREALRLLVPQAQVVNPVATLLSRLQKRRSTFQKQVISVLNDLEHSQAISQLQAACAAPPQPGKVGKRTRYSGILPVATDRIGRRIQKVHQYDPFVHNPDAVFEHHALRIAAKKLRYTMETYASLYRRDLKKPIARIKRLQDLLGDIHDCDVWIEEMSLAIVKQRARRRHPQSALPGTSVSAVAPLRRLLINREKRRARLIPAVCPGPGTALSTPVSGTLCRRMCLRDNDRHSLITAFSPQKRSVRRLDNLQLAPDHDAHSHIVEMLALRLFDELTPLHGLGPRDRILLSYAAMVHDIGWNQGQAGHQKKSAELILSCTGLPVRSVSRVLLPSLPGCMAGTRRSTHPAFLVSSRQPTRNGCASSPHSSGSLMDLITFTLVCHRASLCDPGPDVLCTLTCMGDTATEKARAIRKSDLFAEVFEKMLVIA